MRPDIDALEALDAVVAEGGLAGAAARLHKVPSAVNYQIRKLEQQLGVALLDRSGYRVRLTDAGALILAEGRRLLAQADQVTALALQCASGWEARLTLVIDGILPLAPTLAALKTLADERVPTRIQVRVEFLGGVQRRFEEDRADLMLVKDVVAAPEWVLQPMEDIECLLLASARHPLAARSRVTLADLHAEVELSVQDSGARTDDRHMFGGERVFLLSDFGAKREALLAGVGFGWMPRYRVEADLAAGRLVEIPYVGGSRYRFTPQLVRREARTPGKALQRLLQLLAPAPAVTAPETRTSSRRSPRRPRRGK
jgi:DNA-binding transcriptional LysR family regulator